MNDWRECHGDEDELSHTQWQAKEQRQEQEVIDWEHSEERLEND